MKERRHILCHICFKPMNWLLVSHKHNIVWKIVAERCSVVWSMGVPWQFIITITADISILIELAYRR